MIGYLDMPSGISGDIFLGCLVDAGWPLAALRNVVGGLGLPAEQWQIDAHEVMRGPLRATLVNVQAGEGHVHRHLSDIVALIQAGNLAASVQARAIAVFTRLAQAEAQVHGMEVQQVHFHEVGALDAIIDIVGVCAGLEALGVDQLYAGALPLGPGWTQSAHGRIPLPAPATLNLLAAAGAPTRPVPGPGELVTPTGAALICELAVFAQPRMQLRRIASGAGQKEFDWPNVARLWLGEAMEHDAMAAAPSSPAQPIRLVQLETNIDDMNPEFYGHVSDRLYAAGALDVWIQPIQMKKQRPGTLLSVLARTQDERTLADVLLRETTTLGVRVHDLRRHEAGRQIETVETALGSARVKFKFLDGELAGMAPEYEDCRALAAAHDMPLSKVYSMVRQAAQEVAHGVKPDDAAYSAWQREPSESRQKS